MRRTLTALLLLLPCAGARAQGRTLGAPKGPAEREIRAALCDADRRDYPSAQKRLEQVLRSDPKNVYAQKLLPWAVEEQIMPGDMSPENIALVRRAIELYRQSARNPQFTAAERAGADRHLLFLYRRLGEEDERAEILRRVSDSGRPAKERSDLYVVLASRAWECASWITSGRVAPAQPATEKAKGCVAAGLDYAGRAIILNRDNESAWTYKASLLRRGAALAGIEKDDRQKISYRARAEEADRRAKELSRARQEAEERERAGQEEEERKGENQFTAADALKAMKELTEFEDENSLDEVVKEVFSSVNTELEIIPPVDPAPIPEEGTGRAATSGEGAAGGDGAVSQPPTEGCFPESRGAAQVTERRAWKSFTPAVGELTAELPDNVCGRGDGYVAAGEGVMYSLYIMPGPAVSPDPAAVDAVLNTMARGFVGFRSGTWVGDGLGHSFELRLLRKDDLDGRPRKVYAYALVSCSERKEGVLVVQAGREHYFMFDISGAGESDPRAQRFLKSLRFLHES